MRCECIRDRWVLIATTSEWTRNAFNRRLSCQINFSIHAAALWIMRISNSIKHLSQSLIALLVILILILSRVLFFNELERVEEFYEERWAFFFVVVVEIFQMSSVVVCNKFPHSRLNTHETSKFSFFIFHFSLFECDNIRNNNNNINEWWCWWWWRWRKRLRKKML